MAKAQALYEQAKEAEANLLAQQKEAANAMASIGNFDLYAQLYGLTPEQKGALVQNFTNQQLQNGDPLLASEEAERKAGQAKLDQQYKDMLAFYKETGQYDKWEQLIQQGPPIYETNREKNARIEQETISALKAQFPSGSIYDRSIWTSLMQQYGESWLSKNGFRFAATPHATTPGTGGRTQDVANINW
jgi:multidrug efflux pump subunit AcrA (membrane-fusion protein)